MKTSNDGLKQRLIGAVVLLAIAVIFLPVLFDRKRLEPIDTETQIPPEPQIKPIVIEAPIAPSNVDLAPEPEVMFVPDEQAQAKPEPQPVGLDEAGFVQSWVLQVASFRDEKHAEDLEKQLVASDYSAFSRRSKYKNGSVVRVYIGPKLDKSALETIKAKVDQKYNVQSMILEFKPK